MNYRIIPVTAFAQNCSLIWCGQTRLAALVDPGGDAEKIKQELLDDQERDERIAHRHKDLPPADADKSLVNCLLHRFTSFPNGSVLRFVLSIPDHPLNAERSESVNDLTGKNS